MKNNDSHEFKPLLVEIEDEPSNPLGRTIFWIIVAAFLFFGAWMYLGKVDVVVAARGKVVPVGEVKILQPLNPGVLSRILVKPGDYVASGQVLIEIDPSTTEPELESMKKTAGQLELEQGRINAGLEEKPFPAMAGVDATVLRVQREIYESTKARLAKQLRVKEEELHQVGEQLQAAIKNKEQSEYQRDVSAERLKRLESIKDIISRDDFDKAQSEYQKNESDIKVAGHRISELRAAQEHVYKEIAFIKEDEKSKLLKELADKKKEHIQLLATIEKSSYVNARQQIVSPVNGYVNKLFINTIGGVVTPAEKLILIVPADSPLEIQVKVINKDIGFVASGMDASIKIDTL